MYSHKPDKMTRKASIPHIPSLRSRGRWGRRDVILTLLGLGIIYMVYSSSWGSSGQAQRLESVRLEHHMNSGARNKVWDSKSSFDWSKVKFAVPPGPDMALPRGRAALARVQHVFPPETAAEADLRERRRGEVRRLFRKNWASYRERAWMRDALLPVSGGGRDQFSGWAATLVDSLDTLWIMGLREEFDEAVDAVATIDFGSSTNSRVNMFETTIRYLGGLVGAYDLSGRNVLLDKAVELGDMLYAGFNTENGMPCDFFDMNLSKSGEGLPIEGSVAIAGPGTLLMEFTRLSQITGDAKYYSAVSRMATVFEKGQMKTLLPGMWPTTVSMKTMDVVHGTGFTLGSGADSLYEYVTKMYALTGGREERYRKMSYAWMDAADKDMFFRPMLPDGADILFAGNLDFDADGRSSNLDPESEHLTCFLGATYALGGRLLGRPGYVETGARLGRGCGYAYNVTATGMMCERFNMVKCDSRGGSCPWNQTRFDEEKERRGRWKESLPGGFTTCKDPRYILRPEAIESIFYLWRITGQREYQETAWQMFAAVGNGTETEFANAAVMDVTVKDSRKDDYMESFWLAETLKYFYLALSPPDVISLDDFVLNTEAHPFRLPQ